MEVIDISQKFLQFTDHWSPKIVAQMNDNHIKLVKIQGEFIWHSHPDTDEVFVVVEGAMSIHLRDKDIKLKAGQICVIPKGVEHKPYAENECHVMLIEPAGTVNTGDAGGERTTSTEEWI